jgi:hypothetical protein
MPTYLYFCRPIANIESLAKLLNIELSKLLAIANKSDLYFYIAHKVTKSNGDIRVTYDARPQLKLIHEKIKNHIFGRVNYPNYLQGGLKNRDYISNVKKHVSRKTLVTEDVSNFFPSIKSDVVYKMWLHAFNFSPAVANILTKLTTYSGFVPQGAKTSGYIANLIFWDKEAELVNELAKVGVFYSRLVDDITLSSNNKLSNDTYKNYIAKTYGMLLSKGVKPNRKKHKIMLAGSEQVIHKLNIQSGKPTLPKNERDKIRSAVFQLELFPANHRNQTQYKKRFQSIMGRVNMLSRLHPKEGAQLKGRLKKILPK